MKKLREEDKELFIRYVDFIEGEMEDYPSFAALDWETYESKKEERRNVERWIENIVNSSIDIAKLILVFEKKRIPQTYREILHGLGKTKYFDSKFGERISKWSKLRNILAHEYLDIKWDVIKEFIDGSEPDYKHLVRVVKHSLLDNKIDNKIDNKLDNKQDK